MSIRYSGFASRSFIIGRRLCPPAITRASGPCSLERCDAPSTLVARSYSNAAGICKARSFQAATVRIEVNWKPSDRRFGVLEVTCRHPLAGRADVLALLVLDRGIGADHRRSRQPRGWCGARGVEPRAARLPPSTLRSAGPAGLAIGDRSLAAEPGQRERALGVDLARSAAPRSRCSRGSCGTGRRGAGVEAVDEADRVDQSGLLHQQALEQCRRPRRGWR